MSAKMRRIKINWAALGIGWIDRIVLVVDGVAELPLAADCRYVAALKLIAGGRLDADVDGENTEVEILDYAKHSMAGAYVVVRLRLI